MEIASASLDDPDAAASSCRRPMRSLTKWSAQSLFPTVRAARNDHQYNSEMAGCSITLSLLDDALRNFRDAPVHTAALRWRA